MTNEITLPITSIDLYESLAILEKQYLLDNSYKVIPASDSLELDDFGTSLRFVHLDKVVYIKEQKNIDKLTSVYSALYSVKSTVLLKLVSDGKVCNIYLGLKKGVNVISNDFKVLKGALEGNFPGTTFKDSLGLDNSQIKKLNKKTFGNVKEITALLGIPSLKNKDDDGFIQGMENLILAMQGKAFSAIFIAEPISPNEIEEAKHIYEDIYTSLSSLKEQIFNLGVNDSISFTEGINESLSKTFGNIFYLIHFFEKQKIKA